MHQEGDEDGQLAYQQNVFVGIGTGSNRQQATDIAFDNAWERAKAAGKEGRPLRVQEMWVKGENPIGWCKVVLVDDSG